VVVQGERIVESVADAEPDIGRNVEATFGGEQVAVVVELRHVDARLVADAHGQALVVLPMHADLHAKTGGPVVALVRQVRGLYGAAALGEGPCVGSKGAHTL